MAKMINALRLCIEGFTEVDPADPANVAAASEAYEQLRTYVCCRSIVTGSGCTFSRMRAIEEVPGPAPAAADTGPDKPGAPAPSKENTDLDIPPSPRREPEQASDEQPSADDPLTLLSAG